MRTYEVCKFQAQYFTELVQYIGNVFRKIVYYILNIKIYPREKDIHIYQVYNPYSNDNTGLEIEDEYKEDVHRSDKYEYIPPYQKSYEAHKQFDDYCDANIDRIVGLLERKNK
jgi:hypothetical protein